MGYRSFVAAFAVLLGINAAAQRSEELAVGLLFGFGLLLGLAVAPDSRLLRRRRSAGSLGSGRSDALFVAGFGAAGYATRRDLSSWPAPSFGRCLR